MGKDSGYDVLMRDKLAKAADEDKAAMAKRFAPILSITIATVEDGAKPSDDIVEATTDENTTDEPSVDYTCPGCDCKLTMKNGKLEVKSEEPSEGGDKSSFGFASQK